MCSNKHGCSCHWAAPVGPDTIRQLRIRPATPARALTTFLIPSSPPQTPNGNNRLLHGLGQTTPLRHVTFGPSLTPIQPQRPPIVVDTPSKTPLTRKRKHSDGNSKKTPAKRQKTTESTTVAFGVGPPKTPVRNIQPIETHSIHPPANQPTRKHPSRIRHDIWAFMRPIKRSDVTAYENQTLELIVPPNLGLVVPNSDYVGCILCENEGKRQVWLHEKNVQTSTLKKHLQKEHQQWEAKCSDLGIACSMSSFKDDLDSVQDQPFTMEGFLHYLARWIAVDDQAIHVISSKDFRRLLLYCCPHLKNKQLPGRYAVRSSIECLFEKMMKTWITEVQNSPGRVSFTTDLWTDPSLHPFMAITAHWVDSNFALQARLIAFQYMPGSHDGATLGNAFVKILREHQLDHKVGQITADNASNNGTMMEAMETALITNGIEFSHQQQRVRCFPHVLNLAVHDFLDSICEIENTNGVSEEVFEAVQADPVSKGRDLVGAMRRTSQRRREFEKLVEEAHATGTMEIEKLVLLSDMKVRWDSTFNMLDRLIRMYPAVDQFLARPHNRDMLREYGLTGVDLTLLKEIRQILLLFHQVQELLSSERTPTLSVVLPAYEFCLKSLCDVVKHNYYPHLNHALQEAIEKLDQYVKLARKNPVYGISMFINPTCKLDWISKHWGEDDVTACKTAIRDKMIAFRMKELLKENNSTTDTHEPPSSAIRSVPSSNPNANARAFHNLQSGFQKMRGWVPTVDLPNKRSSLESTTPAAVIHPVISVTDIKTRATHDVDAEIHQYLAHPTATEDMAVSDILAFWKKYHPAYPILWKVARDVLPVQASSVACERIFSLAKLTTTLLRSRMSPKLVEKLQILKFGFRQEDLVFTSDWIMTEEEIYAQQHIDN